MPCIVMGGAWYPHPPTIAVEVPFTEINSTLYPFSQVAADAQMPRCKAKD